MTAVAMRLKYRPYLMKITHGFAGVPLLNRPEGGAGQKNGQG
ncbi:MAG: hypothetical protein AAF514_08405 [Verrucomicrobiota bacterium]